MKSIEDTLKLALEALEELFEEKSYWWQEVEREIVDKLSNAQAAIKEALAQPSGSVEQEPVACPKCKGLGRIYMGCDSWIHCDVCNTTGKYTPSQRTAAEGEDKKNMGWADGGGDIERNSSYRTHTNYIFCPCPRSQTQGEEHMKTVKSVSLNGSKTLETWQKEQLMVATGVTTPGETPHSATYVALIEELEAENRMLRSRNERLTMAMKQMERILQENTR